MTTNTGNSDNDKRMYDLDLDTLMGDSKTIRLNKKAFEITQPDLGELLKLTKLGGKLEDVRGDADGDAAIAVMAELREVVGKLAPALKEEPINVMQMLALLNMLIDMAMPSSVEEFEKRGITLTDDQKKILHGYLNK